MDISGLPFVALFTFGAVNATSIFVRNLTSQQKFALAVFFAFIFAFIPADLGTEVANRIKDAVSIAVGTAAIAGVANKIGGK